MSNKNDEFSVSKVLFFQDVSQNFNRYLYLNFLQNPDNLPVEKLTLSVKNAGVVQNIKALVSTYY